MWLPNIPQFQSPSKLYHKIKFKSFDQDLLISNFVHIFCKDSIYAFMRWIPNLRIPVCLLQRFSKLARINWQLPKVYFFHYFLKYCINVKIQFTESRRRVLRWFKQIYIKNEKNTRDQRIWWKILIITTFLSVLDLYCFYNSIYKWA